MGSRLPVRTCIGCRAQQETPNLVRCACDMTADTRSVVVDWQRKLPGRGAWIHPNTQCVRRAVKSGAFHRAFRTRVNAESLRAVEAEFSKVLGELNQGQESGSKI
ncbi:YlxR family protein [Auritidibacter ignavus]|uniref:YlxR family protein n=1 Tax=Auritidibacter ignavus TaxID=678932 RepID=UPI00244B7DEB|nr:YlxR family protein [Auritidibacter ignavus]WGH87039.1 YlxR family protein [Auritidibacter ignavus]WGH89322.1 YlxR family protein [Auritidibacter ignavus]